MRAALDSFGRRLARAWRNGAYLACVAPLVFAQPWRP
jgi:hypothetical protein